MALATLCSPVVLNKALVEYKRAHPLGTDEEAMRSLIKYNVPGSLPGSPRWHKRHLNDLLCLVKELGMPTFFLTLTADEVSETKWSEIHDLEKILRTTQANLTWRVSEGGMCTLTLNHTCIHSCTHTDTLGAT